VILTFNTALAPVDFTLSKNYAQKTYALKEYEPAESFIPALQNALNEHHLLLKNLTHLGVIHGPGSFTGLRAGLSFAQGLHTALPHLILFHMTTLDALLYAYPDADYAVVDNKTGGAYVKERQSATISVQGDAGLWVDSLDHGKKVVGDVEGASMKRDIFLSHVLLNAHFSYQTHICSTIKPFYAYTPQFKKQSV
jgi:tRNA A37 threonylcarbamoyladenosine modification protein TsaB